MKKRVGTITLGLSLVIFGVLGIIAAINPAFSIGDVLKFWPVVLIGYGIEVIIFSFTKNAEDGLKYDGTCIFFTVMLILCSFIAAVMQVFVEFLEKYPY